jgi:holo-[acyl-carrier protein] synthase
MLNIGCDLCRISQMTEMLKKGQGEVERLFSEDERTYVFRQAYPPQHLAAIFAAKEALVKALGKPGILGKYHREASVKHHEDGQPYFYFSDTLVDVFSQKGIRVTGLSISHDGDYAMAVALVEAGGKNGSNPKEKGKSIYCYKCHLTLDYLSRQQIADTLLRVEGKDGVVKHLCPVCARGW